MSIRKVIARATVPAVLAANFLAVGAGFAQAQAQPQPRLSACRASQQVIKIGSNPVGEWVRLAGQNCVFSYRAHVRCNNTGQTFWKNGPAREGGTWSKVNCSPAFMDKATYQYFGFDGKWHTVNLPLSAVIRLRGTGHLVLAA